jgi:hypothetical protein
MVHAAQAIAFIEAQGDPMGAMVNHVLEIDELGTPSFAALPPSHGA